MSETVIDIILYLFVVGTPIAVGGALLYGIYRLSHKIKAANRLQRRNDEISYARLYRMVADQVPGGNLSMEEYSHALRYTMHKYPAACKHDPPYVALLITEAVGQYRLSQGTLEIVMNDRELEQSEKKEGNETA